MIRIDSYEDLTDRIVGWLKDYYFDNNASDHHSIDDKRLSYTLESSTSILFTFSYFSSKAFECASESVVFLNFELRGIHTT